MSGAEKGHWAGCDYVGLSGPRCKCGDDDYERDRMFLIWSGWNDPAWSSKTFFARRLGPYLASFCRLVDGWQFRLEHVKRRGTEIGSRGWGSLEACMNDALEHLNEAMK